MADKNFFNITGDDTGNIWVNDVLTYTADQPGIRELVLGDIVPPNGVWSDCLKLSGLRRLKIKVGIVDGHLCAEDSVDVNHCQDIELIVDVMYAARTYCFTVKGGSRNVRLQVGKLINHGRETDVDLGNMSDQGNAKTTGIVLNLTSLDHTPIKVRVLTADKPTIENPSQAYTFSGGGILSKLFYPIYNLLKDTLAKVGIKI